MDLKNLKILIKLMVDNGLTEVDLKDAQGECVKLKRGGDTVQYVPAPQSFAPQPLTASQPAATPPAASAGQSSDDGLKTITSPMVGTFYASSSPDAPPFVNIGDRISDESVVCLVEAMKVFNEIKAEIGGTIQAVLVASGQAVEYGQPLFKVKPG
jgi:acetyl-CoA carboxylase biotin carboxyl carrier protein